MHPLPCFALLLCSAGLVACGGSPPIDDNSKYTLELTQTGGIDGVEMRTVVDTTAKKLSFQGDSNAPMRTSALTTHDLDTLSKALNAADLPNAGGPFECSGCADQFHFEAKLTFDGSSSDVIWEDDSGAPEEVIDLERTIRSLDSRFPDGT